MPGEVLVAFKDGVAEEQKGRTLAAVGGKKVQATKKGAHQIKVQGDVMETVARLRKDPNVRSVSPNYIRRATAIPNDPHLSKQWALARVGAQTAWDQLPPAPDTEVRVAVLDTGVDLTHPDLQGRILTDLGRNFLPMSNGSVQDGNGHGTHVAGTIAAQADNAIGVSGIAGGADVKIIPIKMLDDSGSGTLLSEIQALEYLTQLPEGQRPAIINMSFAAVLSYSDIEAWAIQEAANAGILLLAAAGNESADVWMSTPASLPGVLTVAAIDEQGQTGRNYTLSNPLRDIAADFSNWGAEVDLAAPGKNVLAPMGQGQIWDEIQGVPASADRLVDDQGNGTYAYLDGTSMATPVAVGVAALIKAFHPEYTRHQLMAHLLDTLSPARNGDQIQSGWTRTYGYGIANAAQAADTLSADVFNQWALKIENPGNGRSVKGVIDVAIDVDPELVDSVEVTTDDPHVTPSVRWSHAASDQIWDGYLDTTKLSDGSHTLFFTALSAEGAVVSYASTSVVVNNGAPVSGLRMQVQTPNGQPADGWIIDVLQRNGSGQYDEVTAGTVDANGQLLLTGAWAVDGREYEVIANGFWSDGRRIYGVQYRETAVAPGIVLMNGDNVRPVRISAVDQTGADIIGGLYSVPLDKNGKPVISGWGPAATTDFLDPEWGSTANLLLEPGRYNLAFEAGPWWGSSVQAYLTKTAVTIPDGDLASPPVDLPPFSLNDATQLLYKPQYPSADPTTGTPISSVIEVQPEDGNYVAGAYVLGPGDPLWVSKGRYTPWVRELVSNGELYIYEAIGASTDWTGGGTVALTLGNLTPPTISLSAPTAVPGQVLSVKTPLVTDRGFTLLAGEALLSGGDPVSLSSLSSVHQRFIPQTDTHGRRLVRTLKTAAHSPIAQYTDPTPPGEVPAAYAYPYLKITSDVDGSVLYWNEDASWGENLVTLPAAGVPGQYTVEAGVIGLGPIWPISDQVKATAPLAFGTTLSAGMRVRVVEPDGKPGESEVVLYRKVTVGTQTAYAEVERTTTDLFGGAYFRTNDAGDYVAIAYPLYHGPGQRNYLLQGVARLRTEITLDGRTAVPFQLSALRPNPDGGAMAPMKGAFLFATVLGVNAVPVDSPWVGDTSCAAGPCNPGGGPDDNPVAPEAEPAGTRVVWLTPGDYRFAAVDAYANFQLASPDKVTVRSGVKGYSFPTTVGRLTINPPHYDFQAGGINMGWRSFIRPAGSYVGAYWAPADPTQSMSIWVTPGSHEVWSEWVHTALPDFRRLWAYIAASPAISVPGINAGQTNGKSVTFGGAFDANLIGAAVKGTISGQVTITDPYGNSLRSVALSDDTMPGELRGMAQSQAGLPTAGRLQGATQLMREAQVAPLLRSAPSIKLAISYDWPFWGERLTPALQVTNPLYQVSGQNSTDPTQWYTFTYTPPAGSPPGTYSIRLTVPLSDGGPLMSDPVALPVTGSGAGNLKLSRRHFSPGGPTGLTIQYNPVAAGTVAFTVVDSTGKVISNLGSKSVKLGDSLTLTWDGTDSTKKRTVPTGEYKVVATMGKAMVSQPVTVSVLDLGQAWVVGSPLNPDSGSAFVAIVPGQSVDVAVSVVNANDDPVASLGEWRLTPPDTPPVSDYMPLPIGPWDGLDADGNPVAPGTYSFKFTDINNPDLVAYLDFDVKASSAGGFVSSGDYTLPWYSVNGSDFTFTYQGLPGAVTASIVDLNGSVIATMNKTVPALAAGQSVSTLTIAWNGIASGKIPAPGVYRLKVSRVGAPDVYTDFGIRPFRIGTPTLSTETFAPKASGAVTMTISLSDLTLPQVGTVKAAYTAKIQTAAGVDVATLVPNPTGSTTWLWNGKAANASFAPDGNYRVAFTNSLVTGNPLFVPFTVTGVSVPAPSIDPVAPYVTSTTLTVSGTALPGSVVTFTMDNRPSSVAPVTADVNGLWTATFSGLTVGLHKLQAKQTVSDTGFVSPLTPAAAFTVDTQKPTLTPTAPLKATTVASPVTNYVTNGTLTIQATASDAGIPVTLTLDDGVTNTVTTVTSDKNKAAKFPQKLADGQYTATLVATDAAGNVSDQLRISLVVDSQAPFVAAIDLKNPDGDSLTPADMAYDAQGHISTVTYLLKQVGTYTLDPTFSEALTTPKVNSKPVIVGAQLRLSTPAALSVPNSGLSFKVEGKDVAGNAMTVTVNLRVDLLAPTFAPSLNVPTVSAATAGQPATLNFTASEVIDPDTVEVYSCTVTASGCTGQVEVTPVKVSFNASRKVLTVQVPTDTLADGQYQYAVRAADATGNLTSLTSLTWSRAVKVDTALPSAEIDTSSPRMASVYYLTAAVHDDGGISRIVITVKSGSRTLSTKTITVSGAADYDLKQKLNVSSGPATIYMTVIDTAGNSTTQQLDL